MTRVRIEAAVRDRCATDALKQMADIYTARGYTLLHMSRNECRDNVSFRALGAKWIAEQRRSHPNQAMREAMIKAFAEGTAQAALDCDCDDCRANRPTVH